MGKVREKIYLSGFGLVGAVVVSGWSFVVYQRENLLDCAVLPFFSFEHRQKPSAMFELAHTDMHACIQPAKEATRRSMHVLVKHVPLDFSSLGLRVMARTRRLREQLDALAAAVGKAQAQAAKADERAAKADERAARMETEVALLKTSIVNPRLQAFTSDPGDASKRFRPNQKQAIHDIYGNRCAFCGRQEQGRIRLTVAHVANKVKDKDHQKLFDRCASGRGKFRESFRLLSGRNAILLCQGAANACHEQFDAFNLALVPPALQQSCWLVMCFRASAWHNERKHDPVPWRLDEPSDAVDTDMFARRPSFQFEPTTLYRRVLAARLQRTLNKHGNGTDFKWIEFCNTVAELNECQSESGAADDRASLEASPLTAPFETSFTPKRGVKRRRSLSRRRAMLIEMRRRNKSFPTDAWCPCLSLIR